MRTPTLGESGTTLLELMVAMLLLAIALVGLAASLPFSMYGVAEGGLQSTGTALAQATIEDAQRTAYASLPSLDTGGSAIAVPGFPGFTRQIVVTDYSGSPPACSGSTASPPDAMPLRHRVLHR